jgi:predicted RND superfamily exporter protein
MKDIGSLESNVIYNKIDAYSDQNNLNSSIGGIGYLFDKISNKLTLEILIGLLMAVIVIGLLFVIINQFNFNYFFVSLLPNLIPLFSCLGILSLFGFYFSLSNAFIFAIVFGLIVDDSIHIISSYSVSRKRNLSINQSINYCREKTFQALIKTTIVIIVALIPLLFSEFKSISQLASITIITAVIAIIFDILFLPWLLVKFIK